MTESPCPPHPVTAALVVCQCCIVVTLNRSTAERWCHEWWHTKTLNHALICCLPSFKQMPSYYPCSPDVENARQQFIFRLIPFTTEKKWNKPLCCSAALDRLCCNTLKHSCGASPQNGCKHKVAASPRSPGCVRYEIHSRLCVFVSWSRGIINPLNWDSQRLVQIMVLRTQTAPQRDEVGGMLLNATWRLNFKNTSAFMKNGIHVDELFIWWVNIHLQLYAPHRPDIREEQVDYRFKVIGP